MVDPSEEGVAERERERDRYTEWIKSVKVIKVEGERVARLLGR